MGTRPVSTDITHELRAAQEAFAGAELVTVKLTAHRVLQSGMLAEAAAGAG